MNPNEAELFKDPPQLLLDLMKQTFGDLFTCYFLESPMMIARLQMPCIIVESASSKVTIQGAATGTDRIGELVNIHVLMNTEDNLGASDTQDTTKRNLYNIVQGRDPQTTSYLDKTVLGALRRNISLMNGGHQMTLDQDIDVNYDITPRSDQSFIMEAIITIVTREQVYVGTRT